MSRIHQAKRNGAVTMICLSITHELMGKLLPLCAVCNSALLAWLLLSIVAGRQEETRLQPAPSRPNYWITFRPVGTEK